MLFIGFISSFTKPDGSDSERIIIGVSNETDRGDGYAATAPVLRLLGLSHGQYNSKDSHDAMRTFFRNTQVIYAVHNEMRFRLLFDINDPQNSVLPDDFKTKVHYALDEAEKNKNYEGFSPAILVNNSGRVHPDIMYYLEGMRIIEAIYQKQTKLKAQIEQQPGLAETERLYYVETSDGVHFTDRGQREFIDILESHLASGDHISAAEVQARLLRNGQLKRVPRLRFNTDRANEIIRHIGGTLLTAKFAYRHGSQYEVTRGEIKLIDLGMRRTKQSEQFDKFLHNCLEAKHFFDPENTVKFVSYPDRSSIRVTTDSFVQQFKTRIYVSGTMLEFSESTGRDQIDTIAVESHVHQKLRVHAAIACTTTDEQVEKMVLGLASKIVAGQSSLAHIAAWDLREMDDIDIKSVSDSLKNLISYLELRLRQEEGQSSRRQRHLAETVNRAEAQELLRQLGGELQYLEQYKKVLKFNGEHRTALARNGHRYTGGHDREYNAYRIPINIIKESTSSGIEKNIIQGLGNGVVQIVFSANTNRAVDVLLHNSETLGGLKDRLLALRSAYGFAERGLAGFCSQIKSDVVFRLQEIFRLARTSGLDRDQGEIYTIYSLQDSVLKSEEQFRRYLDQFVYRDTTAVLVERQVYPPNALINLEYGQLVRWLDQAEFGPARKLLEDVVDYKMGQLRDGGPFFNDFIKKYFPYFLDEQSKAFVSVDGLKLDMFPADAQNTLRTRHDLLTQLRQGAFRIGGPRDGAAINF